MTWTTDKPTRPGWYWFRPTPDAAPYPVKIFDANLLYVWPVNDRGSRDENVTMRLSDCAGEFAGPISPNDAEVIRALIESLKACAAQLQFVHGRLVPHNYATVADAVLHEDVQSLESCMNRAADVLETASAHFAGLMEPPT